MQALIVHLQVLHGLILREIRTRFGVNRLGYLWALLEPIMMIATFAIFYRLFGRLAPLHLGMMAFLTSGFIPFILFRETISRTSKAVDGNRGLLFYPMVRPLDLALARIFLEFVTQVVVFAILMGADAFYRNRFEINNPLDLLTGMCLASGLGGSFGLLFCSLSTFSPTVDRLIAPLLRPMFWISALFYPATSVPSHLQGLLLLNPLVHSIELVRRGWFHDYPVADVNVEYPLYVILTVLFAGLLVERAARRRIQLS